MKKLMLGPQLRVLHLITGLRQGGAEMTLFRLLQRMERSYSGKIKNIVISLTEQNGLKSEFMDLGIEVYVLKWEKSLLSFIRNFRELERLIQTLNLNIILAWMYHANFLGALLKYHFSHIKLIWNVRNSNLDFTLNNIITIVISRFCALLSKKIPDKIIFCSKVSMSIHQKQGYSLSKFIYIPNGVDLEKFKPCKKKRLELRTSWDLKDSDFIIGFVGRDHPQKDIRTFLYAAQLSSQQDNDLKFVICGKGFDQNNERYISLIKKLKLENKILSFGVRSDIHLIMNGFDLFTSTSAYGEAYPNVIAEAMAMDLTCVATDVGDSAYIIGETGIVVPKRQPERLASAWLKCKREKESFKLNSSRLRIKKNFSMNNFVRVYYDLLSSLSK